MVEEVVSELLDSQTEKIRGANISLIINDYNDIFSSFDHRSYLERALSDDFLIECKKASKDKDENIELRISVPKSKRNLKEEWKIKKRLRNHFHHHLQIEEREIKKIKAEGAMWFALGTIFIMTVSWLHTKEFTNFFIILIRTMLEPAGWFSFLEGLGKVFIVAKEKSPEFEFYKKMTLGEINFLEY